MNKKKEKYEENQRALDEFNERFEKVAADLETAEVSNLFISKEKKSNSFTFATNRQTTNFLRQFFIFPKKCCFLKNSTTQQHFFEKKKIP